MNTNDPRNALARAAKARDKFEAALAATRTAAIDAERCDARNASVAARNLAAALDTLAKSARAAAKANLALAAALAALDESEAEDDNYTAEDALTDRMGYEDDLR